MQLCIQQTLLSKGTCKYTQTIFFFFSFILPGNLTHDLGDATPSFSEKPVYMHRRITFNQASRQCIWTERSPDTLNCFFYIARFLIENSVSMDDLKRWFETAQNALCFFDACLHIYRGGLINCLMPFKSATAIALIPLG